MTISTAKVLDSDSALSDFTAASATPAPALSLRTAARAIPSRRAGAGRAVTAKRRVRVDWYALSVILLILASGAVCFYRLAWAMQP